MRLFFKKIFSKKTLKVVFCLSTVLFLVFMPNFIFNKENFTRDIGKFLRNANSENVVLNLWHIESFEGGLRSRKSYLDKVGIKFNKLNPNIFVNVITLTEEQLVLNLQNEKTPDMFSFSIGSGNLICSFLKNLNKNKNVKEFLQESATLNKEILAYPYMMSCYVAISKNCENTQSLNEKLNFNSKKGTYSFGFATGTNINVCKALSESGIKNLDKAKFLSSQTTYEAYSNFINGKTNTLVGTLRDYYRCKNREKLGKLQSCSYEVLEGYSDLIQYVGINKNLDENKLLISQAFVNFMLNDFCQNMLADYGFFTSTNLKIYQNSDFKQMEEGAFKISSSTNVFSSIENIEKSKLESEKLVFN